MAMAEICAKCSIATSFWMHFIKPICGVGNFDLAILLIAVTSWLISEDRSVALDPLFCEVAERPAPSVQ
jgi:hypothetical protein